MQLWVLLRALQVLLVSFGMVQVGGFGRLEKTDTKPCEVRTEMKFVRNLFSWEGSLMKQKAPTQWWSKLISGVV